MSTKVLEPKLEQKATARAPFVPGLWQKEINVRHFIQQNYTPYYGDGAFLSGPTKRTEAIWKKLEGSVRRGAAEGHPGRFANSQLHHRPRRRIHRQGQ